MENYRLTQTGEEVQDILNGAAMQTDLTAENERAEGAEQTLQGNIDEEERRAKAAEETLSGAIGDEELRAKAAEETLGDAIDGINAKIPAAASSENKLADQDFVNSSIETATATFRGTYNLVSDLHLAVDATHAQIATLLGTVITEADNNDYSYVLVPTSAQTPTEIASIEKYTFGANGWAFAYALNNSGFTSAQWAAINSGITSGLVAKLNALPTNTDLLALLAGKQDVLTFDDVPVEGSNNPVKSGGVHSAIDDEKTARVNAMNQLSGRVDTIEGEIPAQASSENQLADKAYVNSSISTNTATYRGSFNLVADLGLSVSATHEQIGTALAGEISTADNNDYAYVQVPTSDETPSQILKVERYKYNGTAWAFEYELNNSGFTSAQWAALNSGITSGLVGKLNALPTNDELTLALAGKQDVLTFDNTPTENSNNPVKSGGVYAADKALSDAIEAILLLIPSAATSLNKLVDTDLMNSSISTATATFRGTFNLVSDLSLDLTATHAQIATALAGAIATADNNDYAFVQVPTAVGTPTEIASTDRYKFNGTAWAYEYTLNTSGFTSAQWAAINSGITAALVASLADIPDLIPSEATSANQLADKAYVLAQILAATPAFKGQYVTLAELQAVASPKAGDLGIVRTKDSDGMDVFTVYQYLNNAWNVFYSLSYHPQTKPATTGTTGDYPYNGMGRVELAKNMVNTGTELEPVMVNQLTQDMFYKGEVGSRVPNTNTIFVIRYDYVLAENITIPDGCVLEFEGGSISGAYTLTLATTDLIGDVSFGSDITLAGTTTGNKFDCSWISGDVGAAVNKASVVSNNLYLPKKSFTFLTPIVIDGQKKIEFLAELSYNGVTTNNRAAITIKNNAVNIVKIAELSMANPATAIDFTNTRTVNFIGIDLASCYNCRFLIGNVGYFNEGIRCDDRYDIPFGYNVLDISLIRGTNTGIRFFPMTAYGVSENTINGARITQSSISGVTFGTIFPIVIGGKDLDGTSYRENFDSSYQDIGVGAITFNYCCFEGNSTISRLKDTNGIVFNYCREELCDRLVNASGTCLNLVHNVKDNNVFGSSIFTNCTRVGFSLEYFSKKFSVNTRVKEMFLHNTDSYNFFYPVDCYMMGFGMDSSFNISWTQSVTNNSPHPQYVGYVGTLIDGSPLQNKIIGIKTSDYKAHSLVLAFLDSDMNRVDLTLDQEGWSKQSSNGVRFTITTSSAIVVLPASGYKYVFIGTSIDNDNNFDLEVYANNNVFMETRTSKVGTTAERPTYFPVGLPYFDTTLGKQIVHNGTVWVNVNGTAL